MAKETLPPGFKRTPGTSQSGEPAAGHEVRVLIGTGKAELPVPGLTEISSVHVSGVEIPARIPVTFPKDGTGELITINPSGYMIEGEGEDAVLFRSLHSNDGIWQVGAQIAVAGKWSGKQGKAA